MLNQIGLYEEGMPVNQCHEDVEEFYRAEQAGWEVVVNLNSFVYHHQYFSRGLIAAQVEEMPKWLERLKQNSTFLQAKHGEAWIEWEENYSELQSHVMT